MIAWCSMNTATAWIHVADQKWKTPHHILSTNWPWSTNIKYGLKSILLQNMPTLQHTMRSKRIKVTQTPNMLNDCTFTDLIDWTNKRQFWILKGCGCSVLGDRFPLDRPSFVFFFLLSFPLSSFLLPSLSFLFPQLLSFYQTPSGIWAFLTRSAKSSRHYN